MATAARRLKDAVKRLPLVGPVAKGIHDRLQLQRRLRADRRALARVEEGAPPVTSYKIGHEPTIRCNLTCEFCYQGESRRRRRQDLAPEEIIRIYEGIPHLRRTKLVGGEIFVYRGLGPVLDHLDRRGVCTTLQTNGTLITPDNIGELAARRSIRAMIFSLDGPPEVHNAVRGAPDAFQRCVQAIRLVRQHMPWCEIGIFTVLLPENRKHFPELLDVLAAEGISSVQVLLEQYYSGAQIQEARHILENRYGFPADQVWINTRRLEEHPFTLEELRETLAEIRRLGRQRRVYVKFTPEDFARHPEVYHDGPQAGARRVVCSKVLHNEVRIDPLGQVLLCDVVEASFGSLLEQSLEEIASSPRFQDFRRDLVARPLPVCHRCCKAVYL